MAGTPTTNYQLPIYAADDPPDLITGYNGAMAKIDAQMKANADAAAAASAKADGFASRIAALESQVAALGTVTAAEAYTVADLAASSINAKGLIIKTPTAKASEEPAI